MPVRSSTSVRFSHPLFAGESSKKDRVMAGLVCSLGGIVFGYDLGALSSVSQNLRFDFSLSPSAFGLTISASLWGTVVGSMLAGYLAIYLGRRGLIASCAFAYAIASIALAVFGTVNWELLLALRFLCGISIGGFSVGCPLYLAEIAPSELRGRFVAWFQVQVGMGVVSGFALGYLLIREVSVVFYWRLCFGFGAIPPLILLLFQYRMPEEANLFHRNDRQRKASIATQSRQQKLTATLRSHSKESSKLFRRKNLFPLLLATSIALFNQLSGINILLLYLLDVLANTGVTAIQSHRYTLLLASLGPSTTICGMAIVDRIGRKPLLIFGAAGMSICLFVLSYKLLHHISLIECLIILVTYNAFFAFSYGTVTWVYLSELFPFEVRAKGQSYGSFIHWIANAILIALFPRLQHFAPEWSFRFFGFMMFLQILVALIWYPETKGISIRQESEVRQCN